MYMSMKAKTPKKKSWAQSVKDEELISETMDKMGITNPYAKVAAEFDNVFDYKAARAVAELQRQPGLKPDGLFGINTEKAYYDYMRSNPQEVADRYILPNDGQIQV